MNTAADHDGPSSSTAPVRTSHARLTIRSIQPRTVDVPLARPVRTAVGDVPTAPLVLIDVHTDQGIVGRSYVVAYTPRALRALATFIGDVARDLVGRTVL